MRSPALPDEVLTFVVRRRKWAIHRHVHLVAAFEQARAMAPIRRFLAIGCGAGLSELYLAASYPDVSFTLTDYDESRLDRAKAFAAGWSLKNVDFARLDLLDDDAPVGEGYDFIASIEVLEHILEDDVAARNLFRRSSAFVFLLVPGCSAHERDEEYRKQGAWERHEHHRVGYTPSDLRALVPPTFTELYLRNCYFAEALATRKRVTDATDDELVAQRWQIAREAALDLRDVVVEGGMREAQGIEILAQRVAPGLTA